MSFRSFLSTFFLGKKNLYWPFLSVIWQGFWRGNVPALLMVMPYTAIQFTVLHKLKTFASGSSNTGILFCISTINQWPNILVGWAKWIYTLSPRCLPTECFFFGFPHHYQLKLKYVCNGCIHCLYARSKPVSMCNLEIFISRQFPVVGLFCSLLCFLLLQRITLIWALIYPTWVEH